MGSESPKILKWLIVLMCVAAATVVGIIVISVHQAASGPEVTADASAVVDAQAVRVRDERLVNAGKKTGSIYARLLEGARKGGTESGDGTVPGQLFLVDEPFFHGGKLELRLATNPAVVKDGYTSGSFIARGTSPTGMKAAIDAMVGSVPIKDLIQLTDLLEPDTRITLEFRGYVNSQPVTEYYTYSGNCSPAGVEPSCSAGGASITLRKDIRVTNDVLACLRALCMCGNRFWILEEDAPNLKIEFVATTNPGGGTVRDAGVSLVLDGVGKPGTDRLDDFISGFAGTSGWSDDSLGK